MTKITLYQGASIEETFKDFIISRKTKGLADKTIESYNYHFHAISRYLDIIGRPQVTAQEIPQNFMRHYPSYKAKQLNISEFARVCDLSRTTVYKYLSLLES